MSTVASRDLRNHTADVLRRVSAGEQVSVTVHGEIVAVLSPPPDRRQAHLTPHMVTRLAQADAGLRDTLAELVGDTTDDLGAP